MTEPQRTKELSETGTPRRPDPVDAPGRDLRFVPIDPHGVKALTSAQAEHYNEAGFVSPVTIYDAGEAAAVRRYIDDLLASVIDADDRRNSYSINTYHLVCRGLWDIVTEPRIADLVEDILGPNVVCWGSHLFAKLPGDGKDVPFHQDAIYWPLTPSATVTLWLAIDDADAENAAMQFVPGTHRDGALEHETLALDGTRVLGRRATGMEARPDRFLNTLRAGQASLHTDLLLHGSDANDSDRRRAGLTLRFAQADVRLIEGYDDWRKHTVHIRSGDPSGFWRNCVPPTGEHPQLMSGFWGEFDGTPVAS